jgi:hypothetical protein
MSPKKKKGGQVDKVLRGLPVSLKQFNGRQVCIWPCDGAPPTTTVPDEDTTPAKAKQYNVVIKPEGISLMVAAHHLEDPSVSCHLCTIFATHTNTAS